MASMRHEEPPMTEPAAGALRGTLLRLGDDVRADHILPPAYAFLSDPVEMGKYALSGLGREWPARLAGHAVLWAGRNLGAGTGREASAICLRGAGVQVIVAPSVARLFFRNAINNGILVLEIPEAAAVAVEDGDEVVVDLAASTVAVRGRALRFPPLPPLIQEIVAAGGLVEYGRRLLAASAT
jgi:3-isopropylmalate/(R)-2-methylmalate dehydratase small subunit